MLKDDFGVSNNLDEESSVEIVFELREQLLVGVCAEFPGKDDVQSESSNPAK